MRRQEEEISPPLQRLSPASMSPDYRVGKNPPWGGSLSLTEYKVLQVKENSELYREEISPPPSSSSTSSSCGKIETLESLIKADASKINSFRIFEGKPLLPSMPMPILSRIKWQPKVDPPALKIRLIEEGNI
uniref:Uncharacterized protein n=1 Tax=Nelumbo nucifera TaxID=4432 RepID=A0A822XKA3_NELNU|nr:TPA_asm: hypothetical protein HUJ06_020839 [Nelumbo nucifera]